MGTYNESIISTCIKQFSLHQIWEHFIKEQSFSWDIPSIVIFPTWQEKDEKAQTNISQLPEDLHPFFNQMKSERSRGKEFQNK